MFKSALIPALVLAAYVLNAQNARAERTLATVSVSGTFSQQVGEATQPSPSSQTFTISAADVDEIAHVGNTVYVRRVGGEPDLKLSFGGPEQARLAADVLRCQRRTTLADTVHVDSGIATNITGSNYHGVALGCERFVRAFRSKERISVKAVEPAETFNVQFASAATAKLGLQLINCQSTCAER